MNRRRNAFAFLTVFVFAGFGALAQNPSSSAADVVEINMTAKKYEFNPSVVKVKKGQHVRLVITALDREHGFKLEAFHINKDLSKGEAVTVEFTTDRSGTFPFQCSRFCGFGHRRMKGKLIVE